MKFAVTISEYVKPMMPFVLCGDIYKQLEYAHSINYDAAEIHVCRPANVDVDMLISKCEKNKMQITSFGTGFSYTLIGLTLTHPDHELRMSAINRIKEYIDLAYHFNSVVIIGLTKGNVGILGEDVYFRTFSESIYECLTYAEKKGVNIAIEAINRYESNVLNNIESIFQFIKPFNSDNIKIHIDSFHMNIEESDFCSEIFKYGSYIGHVHFADNNRLYPGQGHINFREILDALIKVDYKGNIGLECLPLPTGEECAVKGRDYVLSLMNSLN